MRKTTVGRLTATALAVGAIGGIQQSLAQTEVYPGTQALFGPSDVDGAFTVESADCDGLANLCRTASDTSSGEAYTYTASLVNQTQSTTALSGLYKQFDIPNLDGEETVLNASVSGSVSWRGSFYIVDLTNLSFATIPSLGAKAEGFVRVSLVDVTDPDHPFDVGNEAIEDFGCDIGRELAAKVPVPLISDGIEVSAEVGWCEEERSETFSFPAKVVTGRTYELQLSIMCQSMTGVKPTLLSVCTFNDTPELNLSELVTDALGNINVDGIPIPQLSVHLGALGTLKFPPGDDPEISVDDIFDEGITPITGAILDAAVPNIDKGFLSWDYMSVAIAPDMSALVRDVGSNVISRVRASEVTITTAVGEVGEQVEVVRRGVGESIELLHTPSGKRESGPVAGYPDLCGDGQCDWGKQ